MKKLFYFDIHECNVTEIIYHLLFTKPELVNKNDGVYKINPWFFKEYAETEWENKFKEELPCMNRCYSGLHPLKGKTYDDRIKNVPSLNDAIDHFWEWLKTNGVTEDDNEIIVELWW